MISLTSTLIAAAVHQAMAQINPVDVPDLLRCANWTFVHDKPGTWRQLYLVEFDKHGKVPGEILTREGLRRGMFDVPSEKRLAVVLSNADSEGIGFPVDEKVAVQFTLLLRDSEILFYPSDHDKRVPATGGFLELSRALLAKIRNARPITCIQSAMDTWEEPESKPLGDLDPIRKPEFPKSLAELGASNEPTKLPPAKPNTAEPVSRDSTNKGTKPPAPKPPVPITAVCSIGAPQQITLAASIKPKPLQAVGLRNNDAEAEKFDFVSAANDAVPLGSTFDLTNSRGKLVPYDAVARDGTDLWVSLLGVEEPRTNPKDAAVKTDSLLRVIVVGGPAEVAISGLAEVGAELKKLSAGRIKLSIEWHVVGPSGAIASAVGHYNSFDKMAKAAAEMAAGGRPDLLNEEQLHTLLDDFENHLKERSEPVEKVFWIKGAYPIPSSIPLHLEKFIKTASSTEAIAGGPGRSSKWFVLVTARMAGFSINYLKEPIYSLQIGDLIEEGDAAINEPRRFIRDTDTALLATRLQLAAVPMPAQTPGAVTGKLVFKAADVFEERGYLLSQGSIRGLQTHLKLVANKLDEA
jgi:hypothetical protein